MTVSIIGGGISGIQCALDLSEAGIPVTIIEAGDAVGGIAALLDKTFPTNDCSMCTLAPKLVELSRRSNVNILTRAQVQGIRPHTTGFTLSVTLNPRYVDIERCVACGRCERICPSFVTEKGLFQHPKKAISRPYAQAVPNAYAIDPEACLYFQYGSCTKCREVCPTSAINFKETQVITQISSKRIVIATGASLFDPTGLFGLGYGTIPNVITNLEMEIMQRATGPTKGRVIRPSDGHTPKNIAWIQCAGSRTTNHVNRPFCSSTCCMSSVKEAINARNKCHDIMTDIFFVDIRAHQKGSEEFCLRAKKSGVNFIIARVSGLREINGGRIELRYREPGNGIKMREYDLVVLSVGRAPNKALLGIIPGAETLYDHFGFIRPQGEETFRTKIDGIFACGAATGPKSIPNSIVEGSAAAGAIIKELSQKNVTSIATTSRHSPPKNQRGDGICILICRCGGNISDNLDCDALKQHCLELPAIETAELLDFACSRDSLAKIQRILDNKSIGRVVVAACSPHTHEAMFKESLLKLGIDPQWVTMANIRNQVAWAHKDAPKEALEKALDQIKIEVERLRHSHPSSTVVYPVTRSALVIGGGVAGLRCALELADQGIHVTVVERKKRIGGNAQHILRTWRNTPMLQILSDIKEKVLHHPLVHVLTRARLVEHSGKPGAFTSKVVDEEGQLHILNHGVTIVAVGAKEHRPREYLYGKNPNVLTHQDLDKLLISHSLRPEKALLSAKTICFIQCVGSREPSRPYCSRVCCTHSVNRALFLKDMNPQLDIYVFYRQMRTYGLMDTHYLEARKRGIHMIPYHVEKKPIVKEVTSVGKGGQPVSRLFFEAPDLINGTKISLFPDIICLASAICPDLAANRELSKILGIPLDEYGFFKEANLKLRPVETLQKGIFLAGLAQFPKELDETLSQCSAAVSRAVSSILSKDIIAIDTPVARILDARCDGCGVCVEPCPFDAIRIVEYVFKNQVKRMVEIEAANCTGCGICVSTCPKDAVEVAGFEPRTIFSQIDAMCEEKNG